MPKQLMNWGFVALFAAIGAIFVSHKTLVISWLPEFISIIIGYFFVLIALYLIYEELK